MELRRDGKTGLVLFVSNVGAVASPRILIRKADGTWRPIGGMVEIK